jgi:hypothetical protein
MNAGRLGYMDTPAQGNTRPPGVRWAADNGCYGKGYPGDTAWLTWLRDNAADALRCEFATAPDVVGDAWLSHLRSAPWLSAIRELGYPAAYVAQNGIHLLPIPWHEFDVLFLGGVRECVPCRFVWSLNRGRPARREPCPRCHRVMTEWKEGTIAARLTAEARRRGKRVHMGRANSLRRLRRADEMGCSSADGTFLTIAPDHNLGRLLHMLDELVREPMLGSEVAS